MQIQLKHKDSNLINTVSNVLADRLRQLDGIEIMGPAVPMIAYIRNYHIRNLLIKLPINSSLNTAKFRIIEQVKHMQKHDPYKGVLYSVNVDPA